MRLAGRRRPEAGGGAAERAARRRVRAGPVPGAADVRRPTIRSTRCSGTSPPSTWSGRGTSTPAARRTSSSPCSTPASPTAARVLRYTAIAWQRDDGVLFPALGTVDIPFAAAPDLGGPDRFVAPRDFIWDDELPFDMDGHGTHVAGTHRPAHQQQRRRRRHGLQRPADAGEGHRRRVGLHLQQPVRRHRRHRGARHPLRGGQRRQGDQHEHRPQRSPGAGGRGRRSPMPSRTAPSWPWPAATSSQRPRAAAAAPSSRRSIDGMVAVGAIGTRPAARGATRASGRSSSWWRPAATSRAAAPTGGHPAADARPRSRGDLRRQRRAVPRAALRRLRLLLLHGHLDGDAARRRASRRC